MSNRLLVPGVGLGGVLLGIAVGWLLRGEPSPGTSAGAASEATCAPAPSRETSLTSRRTSTSLPTSPEPAADVEPPPVTLHTTDFTESLAPRQDEAPVPWPGDLAEDERPEAVAASLRDMVHACGAEDALVAVDCSEPPCLVAFDSDLAQLGPDCAAWEKRWGREISTTGAEGLCADGSVRSVTLVGPSFPDVYQRIPKDPKDPWKSARRMQARARAALGDCALPSTLTIDNLPGHHLTWVPDP